VAKGGSVRAKRVLIATNGFTEDKLHPGVAGTMLPAISNIITTRPLTEAERAAHGWATGNPIWDNRHLFFYFRMLKDGRFLIGARGNTTARPEDETIMREKLTRDVARMWPGWRDVEISHAWRGFVCLSRTLAPNVGSLADDPSVFHALAYHGSGVAWANWSGRAAARLIAGNAPAREVVPAVIAQPLRKFPLPALRVWYLRGAYFKYGLQDRLEKD
jgi:glycine/D-amino acid oxidase-like deaminating enzyme